MDIPTQGSRKPGARKLQILQMLASMLEEPKGEKVTTAALAARLDVSEAALYRHFASKAQMFEGLIEFIETTIFGLINKISTEEAIGSQAGTRDGQHAARLCPDQPWHDTRSDRRCAGQRERATAGAHESIVRAHRSVD